MALPLLLILKTLPTIVTAVREVTSSVKQRRASGAALKIEDRTKKLENDFVQAGTALGELATQLQAIVEELRTQASIVAAQRREVIRLRWISLTSLASAMAAVVFVFLPR